METREQQFDKAVAELKSIFVQKNKMYGDDFFSGDYSDQERWLSIRRKVARLDNFNKNPELVVDGETLKDTWSDLAIYSIMELMLRGERE